MNVPPRPSLFIGGFYDVKFRPTHIVIYRDYITTANDFMRPLVTRLCCFYRGTFLLLTHATW